jgi:flagellar assembly protein FliH
MSKVLTIEIPSPGHSRLKIIPSYEDESILAANFAEFDENDFPDGDELLQESDLPEPISYAEAQQMIQDAYDRGFDDGKQVTAATMTVEIQEQQEIRNHFEKMILRLHGEFQKITKQMEELSLNIAVEIAETIIADTISHDASMVIRQARKAIDGYRNAQTLRVRINPHEYEAIEQVKNTLIGDTMRNPDITIIADSSIARGGCIVESDIGAVDAQITTQLQEIRRQLHAARLSE